MSKYQHLDPESVAYVLEQCGDDPTLEMLADYCDGNAQSDNLHEFVGVHRLLAALLHRKLGRAQASLLFMEIAIYGGLHAMQANPSAYADLGIQACWQEWSLSEK